MNKIVALIDFSEVSRKVIEYGAVQAKAHGAELYLLHVEPESTPILYRKIDEAERNRKASILRHEHSELLARAAEIRSRIEVNVHPVLMESAEVEETIVAEVEKLGAEEVILGNHHHGGLHNYFFGSVGQKLMKDLDCPLTLISETVVA